MRCPFCKQEMKIIGSESQAMAVQTFDPHYHDNNQKAIYFQCPEKHRLQFVGKIECPGCNSLDFLDGIEEYQKRNMEEEDDEHIH